jgi:Protein of unknown function (DUF2608)
VDYMRSDSMECLRELKVDKDTLVIFDVHMTLYQPNQPEYWMRTFQDYRKIMVEVTKDLTPEQKARMLMLSAQTGRGATLLDPRAPAIMAWLQEKGATVVANTASLAEGDAGRALREELAEMGFSFTEGSNVDLGREFAGVRCTFTDGVITSNTLPKGEISRAWMDTLAWKPTHVIAIDDKANHLENIAANLPEGVRFTGLEFTKCFGDRYKQSFDEQHLREVWGALAEEAKAL